MEKLKFWRGKPLTSVLWCIFSLMEVLLGNTTQECLLFALLIPADLPVKFPIALHYFL